MKSHRTDLSKLAKQAQEHLNKMQCYANQIAKDFYKPSKESPSKLTRADRYFGYRFKGNSTNLGYITVDGDGTECWFQFKPVYRKSTQSWAATQGHFEILKLVRRPKDASVMMFKPEVPELVGTITEDWYLQK
jgi:hypothetical protein